MKPAVRKMKRQNTGKEELTLVEIRKFNQKPEITQKRNQ